MTENAVETGSPLGSSSVVNSTTAAAATPPTDPFQFLAQHIERRVAVTLLSNELTDAQDGGAVVTGTLLSVDDLCNVLLRSWTCTESVAAAVGAAAMHPQQQQRKKARTEGSSEEGESLRLIRGAQIASISLLA
ncbi:hypothetical protein ABB37_04256 [Leptomonas pyrrhocoris]|uniref:LSM domain-containing protein n=1 Tax=Leptomonas pyrrhocoris TaxID=157538 RepID=A0A0N0VFE3_LEPPY|nr:hypothetical protein ABB37_04256 [Leptomonas pyrrhocoris]KPA80828.1 hypothetical protein ABB37_04256 [Leptomonas pyrrhocoris]|eukprot:XP_015659267.1 hypothetical protein ABB37_04256 [Leptomonas pyrrhocoris]